MIGFLLLFCFVFAACTNDNDEIGTYIPNENNPKIRSRNIDLSKFDEYFKYQGYLNYFGEYGLEEYEEQAAIDILPAWEITKGKSIKVAILDDGIQKSHEDFGNISVWNCIDESNSAEPSINDKKKYSHGTGVTGTVAAKENGSGIIGVAPECEILFIGNIIEASDAQTIAAFEYAKKWGAKVISNSWGSYDVPSTLESKIKELHDEGITIIFAAGNGGKNMDNETINDESELEWVIGVSAADKTGIKAGFSDYGSNIDIMAPGEDMLTLDMMGSDGRNNATDFANENYMFIDGTSFSTPIATGVAALMLAANPNLKPAQIREIIIETARKNPPQIGSYNSNGFSLHNAYGLINAAEAVRRAAGITGNTAISSFY